MSISTGDASAAAPRPSITRSGSRLVLLVLLSIFLAGLVVSSLLAYRYRTYTTRVTETSKAQLQAITLTATASIDGIVSDAVHVTDDLAAALTNGTLTHDAMLLRMKEAAERHGHLYGVCVSYTPFAFDPKRRLYSAYFVKKAGRLQFVQLDTVYDYTSPEVEWFTPVVEHGALWTQPYYDEAGTTSMITYSRPFYGTDPRTKARAPIGTVSVDISMDEIRAIIESLDLGPSGFGALVSQKGIYLYHPDVEYVQARRTLGDVAREAGDRDRLALVAKVAARESGLLEHRSRTTGLPAWLVYAPVPTTGWSLQNTFIVGDLPFDVDAIRRQLMLLIAALIVCGSAAVALAARTDTGKTASLWTAACGASMLIAVGIGAVWHVALTYDSRGKGGGVAITDKATLGTVMNGYVRTCAGRHTEPPVYVPTGVFIESAHFSTPNDLAVAGYVWQKYKLGAQDGVSRGFTIGDASDMEAVETYRTVQNGSEIVRWHFSCTTRQAINHRRYPLEQETLGLRILHKDLDHNVVLVPDLDAYTLVTPSALPGLDRDLIFPGWNVTRSFFEFRNKRYNSNFGVERSMSKEAFPSLYFDVAIQRNFVDAFISNLTALIIVSILLFTLLMIAVRDERLVGYMQAGSGRILSISAAMFFVIAFSHVDIRRKIAAEEVFYLEYFYLLIYVAILWVSINSVLFAMGSRIWLIQYRENLISKLLFWPFLLMLLFGITVGVFY